MKIYLLDDRYDFDLYSIQKGDSITLHYPHTSQEKEKKAIAIHNHSFQERIRKNDSIYIDIDFWNIEKKLSLPPSLDDGLFLKWEIAKRRFIKHIVKDSQGFHKLDVENEDDLRLSKRTFGQLYCMYILVEKARNEKQALEMALMKEKEIALQSQLNSLKLQINPHFMFNNFNNLLELIEEDSGLAGKFLSNLSKVYRYIITNLDRNLIPVADEIKFLDSYLYLMKVRHDEGVIAKVSPGVRQCKGFLPPAVLQLLVENAIKHNSFSSEHPLVIDIKLSDDYITVSNLKSPLMSPIESTGLGLKNITERYALLCDKKVKIENAENFYSVSLPIIKNINPYENTDS